MVVGARRIARHGLMVLVSGALVAPTAALAQSFVDVSAAAGLGIYQSAGKGMATGAAAADFDDDGFVDIYLPTSETTPNRLYRNLGNGTFEEIAAQVGLEAPGISRAALWLDYDGDGDLDLWVAGDCRGGLCAAGESQFRLFRQDPGPSFTDVTVAMGLYVDARSLSFNTHCGGLASGDLDNDGDLDLFAGLWFSPPARIFLYEDGLFVDHSTAAGVGLRDYHWQPVIHDFNGDGWQDVFVAVDFGPNRLWINQRDGTFCDAAPSAGVDSSFNEMGVVLGDYDNDGDLDIYITNIYEGVPPALKHNRLYRNEGMLADCCSPFDPPAVSCPVYSDVAIELEVAHSFWGWGTTFIDGDNGGLLDIAATNGFTGPWSTDPSRYFENQGGSPVSFLERSTAVGFDDPHWGSALLAFDADRDGDLDLVQATVTNEESGEPSRLRLLENQLPGNGPAGHYLSVRPRMAGPNTHAIGAVVRVRSGSEEQMRLITAGTSLLGQEPAEAFFGLGGAAAVDELVLEWPDGVSSRFGGVTVDRLLTVRRAMAADLAITLDDGVDEIEAPGTLSYLARVTNAGAGDITGGAVAVALPAGISCGPWSCLAADADCAAAAPAGDLADSVDLLVGGSATYAVECAVPAAAAGSELVATASVSGPGESPDPDPADNAAVDATTVVPCPHAEALTLTGLEVLGYALYQACSSITLGASTVAIGGELVLDAPSVRLGDGVAVHGRLELGPPP